MSTTSARDQKLRKACNACNAAKVRCSGEKTGCSRCQASYLECIYTTSRVGKNPGLRAKKPRPREEPSPVAKRNSAQRPPARTTPRRPSDIGEWSSEQPMNEGLLLDDVFDVDFNLHDAPPTPSSRQSTLYSPYARSTASSSFLPSRLSTSELNSFDEPTSSIPSVTTEPPPSSSSYIAPTFWPAPTEIQLLRTQTPSDSECVMACCTIISQLEAYIDAHVKVLDLALDCVRKAVAQLNEIVERGSSSRYCHMLLGVGIYQIVYILERACKLFLEEDGARTEESTSKRRLSRINMITGFGFGGVRLDPGEQRAFRARVVLKDVRKVTTISRHVMALAARDMPVATAQACHNDMIQRLESLEQQLVRLQNS